MTVCAYVTPMAWGIGCLHVKLKDLIKQKVVIADYGKVKLVQLFCSSKLLLFLENLSIIILKCQKGAPNLKIHHYTGNSQKFFHLCTTKQMHWRLLEYNSERFLISWLRHILENLKKRFKCSKILDAAAKLNLRSLIFICIFPQSPMVPTYSHHFLESHSLQGISDIGLRIWENSIAVCLTSSSLLLHSRSTKCTLVVAAMATPLQI